MATLSARDFTVIDTLDGDIQLVWEYDRRTWFYRHDGAVFHGPTSGAETVWDLRIGLGGLTRSRRRLEISGPMSIRDQVIAYMVTHHGARVDV